MISLYDILEASNGQLFGEPAAQIFTDFCVDASSARENMLFLALKTDHGDTHHDIPEAIANGVAGIICMRPPEYDTYGVSVVLVRDTVDALLAWVQHVIGKLDVRVSVVAGSIGKSVTLEAIRQVLSTRYSAHAALIDVEGRLALPLALSRLSPSHQHVIVKLQPSQAGEMAAMVQAVQPEVAVITHLPGMEDGGTPDAEQQALMDYLSPTSLAILNYDLESARALSTTTRAQVRTIGIDTFGADMMAFNIVAGPDGTGFDLRYGGERFVGHWVPLLGKHLVYSVMAALTVGLHYGIPLEEGLKALKMLEPVPGRMNGLIGKNDSLLVDDTYAANPQSTLAALDWLSEVKHGRGRAIFVMGSIGEGEAARQGYRSVGRRAAEVVDVFITQGIDAAQAARSALDYGMDISRVRMTYNPHDTAALLEQQFKLNADDIVLLKGTAKAHIERVTRLLIKDPADNEKLVRGYDDPDAAVHFQPVRSNWVEIDATSLANNVRAMKALIGSKVSLMAVVKSDAYGHGAVSMSQTALLNGANYLGVSSMHEALELREAGIDAPILVMGYTPTYLAQQAVQHGITVTLYDLELARAFDRTARELNTRLRAHVKVDSGMGRLGIMPDDAVTLFRHLGALRHIEIEGIYTHFSAADEDPDYTAYQLDVFKSVYKPLQATTGVKFKYIHAANSAATIAHKEAHFNMVRVGLALYGMHPSDKVRLPEGFSPALTWKTAIAQVKTLPPDHAVGYGNTYTTRREERVGIIPVGYADGFRRAPEHWGEMLVHGVRVPIIGRVSMEKTVVSLAAVPDVAIGDEVVLLGRQGNDIITAEEVAARLGTINYEVVCNILPRMPRR